MDQDTHSDDEETRLEGVIFRDYSMERAHAEIYTLRFFHDQYISKIGSHLSASARAKNTARFAAWRYIQSLLTTI